MTAETFRLPVGSGELTGEFWPGDGPIFVLLHAGIADRRGWHQVAPSLHRFGGVVAYDRRGYGDSAPSRELFSHLTDLLTVLDRYATGPAVLVGSSMGGGLALDAALTVPDRVSALALFAPAITGAPQPAHFEPGTAALRERQLRALAEGDLDRANQVKVRIWLDGPGQPAGRVGGQTRELALDMNAIVTRNLLADTDGDTGVNAWDRLEATPAPTVMPTAVATEMPTVVAWGDLDVAYLVDQCDRASRRIPGAVRRILPGTAHLPYLERPDLVVEIIRELLDRVRRI